MAHTEYGDLTLAGLCIPWGTGSSVEFPRSGLFAMKRILVVAISKEKYRRPGKLDPLGLNSQKKKWGCREFLD